MYIPKLYKNEDQQEVLRFIEDNGFAILVNQAQGRIAATHIPLYLTRKVDGAYVLSGHVSKANEAWKGFGTNCEVLAIFPGPHAYVSSSWYQHENVPTWNYIAVHVYGVLKLIEGIDRMSPGFVEREMKGIVGFEILITEIQPAYKLSQNRNSTDHASIVSELRKSDENNAAEIAREMEKNRQESRQPEQ